MKEVDLVLLKHKSPYAKAKPIDAIYRQEDEKPFLIRLKDISTENMATVMKHRVQLRQGKNNRDSISRIANNLVRKSKDIDFQAIDVRSQDKQRIKE